VADGVANLERLHRVDADLPWVVKTASGVDLMEFKEELEIDVSKKFFKGTYTMNTWGEYVAVTDITYMRPHPQNPEW
jgi:hypothetical protein